ncbi:MAG: hypothetical protein GWO41_03830, partial [candidate division Zixibacteria bacterium]|nr:hypothetical protein [candidate division Zixibacteria bacterium]NIR65272.1 hypothetical protein [candidate division Zixibacteria bacterium]NIS15853.1 hypothetical protein [candidate division Zixibacteria bacterium]NIS48551.1 hypothetical protein [candidate division Zixibacteria bacterium]NIT51887.1 hypothetical protein [candidate division Zixibacteria bacterium]
MRILNNFYGGTLAVDDTLEILKVKAVSLTGQAGLRSLMDKGRLYALKYPAILDAELSATPTTITLNYYLKKAPVQVFVTEAAYGLNVPFEYAIDDGGLGWLEVTPLLLTTPGSINIDYDAAVAGGLAEGTYTGTVTITSPEIGEDVIVIDVTLNVTTQTCQGLCGDANNDGSVNVSDAVYIINFVFVGGGAPQPVQACGDANSDASVNVSDAVYVINFVFVGGGSPTDCSPGSWDSNGGDCCPF